MMRSAVFSRVSGSRPANCHATAAAEETSMIESRPKPINAVDDAIVPAVMATAASTRLKVMVAATVGEPELGPRGWVQVTDPVGHRGEGARAGDHRAHGGGEHARQRVPDPSRVSGVGNRSQGRQQPLLFTVGDGCR